MIELQNIDWLIIALASLMIGVSKTAIPGLGILAVSLVACVMPAKASTGVILPMLIVGDVFAVWYYKRHAVWPHLIRLIPWAVVGIIIGYYIMDMLSDRQLRPMIGAIVLAIVGINYWRTYRSRGDEAIPTQWWFAAIFGLLAGTTTMLSNAAGPIMAIYLLSMQLPKNEFLGTGAWYFLLLNCFKVPFSKNLGLINSKSLTLNLVNMPWIVIGSVAGIWVLKYIPEKAFVLVIQLLAVAAALKLIFQF